MAQNAWRWLCIIDRSRRLMGNENCQLGKKNHLAIVCDPFGYGPLAVATMGLEQSILSIYYIIIIYLYVYI